MIAAVDPPLLEVQPQPRETYTSMPDQLSPSREFAIPRPSVLDVLRQCEPSRELIGLLLRELQSALTTGRHNDAAALFALAMCVREAIA